ncbi:endolysin [Mycobacterium phage Moonbeam]|uniref:Lysin A n=1 Tax=Mycobacterium phage Moonbeam TaxID=2767561 RepID=A0A7G9UXF8_9CAUD|nr:endolysin [Mycobacterium phage Moonbeam]QNN98713.1 lysin A [Mycobacterium phage Moonbeam]
MTHTNDTYAREILRAGNDLGITPRGIVIAFATVFVESDWYMWANAKVPESLRLPHERVGNDGRSVGLFQQQVVWGNGAWWWGDAATCMDPYKSARLFFERLKTRDYSTGDPGAHAQAIQRSAYPDRYGQRMSEAQNYYNQLAGEDANVGFSGDPVWLEDVLREALGDRLVVAQADWKERGTGGVMGDIWGVMIHHTGNDRETVAGIRDGRPDLRGPLSQCLITPDGKCHLIAVGPCNHAGAGSYPGVGANNGNQRLIGFECAWPTIRPDGSFNPAQRWPDAQIITMRDATAAVLKRLGHDSNHVIGHKEWAGATQGKWDPGNLDMNWFRGEVQKDLDGFVFPGEQPSAPQPGPTLPPDYDKEVWDQLRILWPQLGHRTLVDAVAAIGAKLGIEGCYDVKGKS